MQVWQVKSQKSFNLLSEIDLDFRREPSGVFPCLLDGDESDGFSRSLGT